MEGETNAYIQRMSSLKDQLKEQAKKFESIEQEKDKIQRKLKQKEYVHISCNIDISMFTTLIDDIIHTYT